MKPKILWPVRGKYPITFRFGEAPLWYTRVFGYPHNGVDIGCPVGTPILGCDDGEVVFSDDIPDWDGKGMILKHKWGMSLYWHLSRLIAGLGHRVERGAVMAHSGRTGFVTGPHLHFGIKIFGVENPEMRNWVDPLKCLQEEMPAPFEPPVQMRHHLVLPGQTLWGLAEKYYGNGLLWRRIYLANKEKIKNPNLIHPLQRLMIP